jgi:hypothetical protein
LFWFDPRFLSSAFLVFCALTLHVIGLLVFATVFAYASAFNGDLHQWNVASVTSMTYSKSIRIVWKNALTCREVSCCCVIWRVPSGGGFGVGGDDCAVKVGIARQCGVEERGRLRTVCICGL